LRDDEGEGLKQWMHSPVTVRRHYNMLNQLFNMAIRERATNDNPCRLVSRTVLKNLPIWQNRDRWLNKYSPDEEERLFAAFGGIRLARSSHLPHRFEHWH
jgi:hypothetical protein